MKTKTLTIGELKTNFSEVLEHVRQGETVVISYGRKKEKVAALIPYRDLHVAKPRSLGLATCKSLLLNRRDSDKPAGLSHRR